MNVAILITVFNRLNKTIECFNSILQSFPIPPSFKYKIFLTDDGSTDGTSESIKSLFPNLNIEILKGNGQLYWNGGMNNSWLAAIKEGGFDGYLWLNNDSIILPNLWNEIIDAHQYSMDTFGQGGVYIGSTYNKELTGLSYGGFNFINRWTLKDQFVIPNGKYQNCQAGHGNITFISDNVVKNEGVFCDKYIHSGGDHDYTYLAFKHGFPVFILKEYVGICDNDHTEMDGSDFINLKFQERKKYLKSPLGYNLNNTLLFQKRCFPYRYFPVLIAGYAKLFFPRLYFNLIKFLRK